MSFKTYLNESKRIEHTGTEATELYAKLDTEEKHTETHTDHAGNEILVFMSKHGVYFIYKNAKNKPMYIIQNPDKKDLANLKDISKNVKREVLK